MATPYLPIKYFTISRFLGAAAEMDRKESSYRTRRGLEGKALKGLSCGGRAFGYDIVGDPLGKVTNPTQAALVRRIFENCANGMSARATARLLNAEGIPSPGAHWKRTDDGLNRKTRDKGWRASAIKGDRRKGTGILNNPIYIGQVIWKRTYWERGEADSKRRRVTRLSPDQWIRHERPDLRIIDDELWERVQAIQNKSDPKRDAIRLGILRAKSRRGRGPGYFLSGLIVCASCGANFVGSGPRDFLCPTHDNGGSCANNMRFNRLDTHQAFCELLREHLLKPERIERERKRCEAILREREKAGRAEAARATDTDEIDVEIARLKSLGLSPGVLTAALGEAERQRAAVIGDSAGKVVEKTAAARRSLAELGDFAQRFARMLDSILPARTPNGSRVRVRPCARCSHTGA